MSSKKSSNKEQPEQNDPKPRRGFSIPANGFILHFPSGELYRERVTENVEVDGQSYTKQFLRPLNIAEILSGPLSEGLGVDPKNQFTAVRLGGELWERRDKEGEEAELDVSSDELNIIKNCVKSLKGRDAQGNEKSTPWLQLSLLLRLDSNHSEGIADSRDREFVLRKYEFLQEKVEQWLEEKEQMDVNFEEQIRQQRSSAMN